MLILPTKPESWGGGGADERAAGAFEGGAGENTGSRRSSAAVNQRAVGGHAVCFEVGGGDLGYFTPSQ